MNKKNRLKSIIKSSFFVSYNIAIPIGAIIGIAGCILFTGCIDEGGGSGSKKSSDSLEIICKVQTKTKVPFQSGDIGFYDCGPYRVIVTRETSILETRNSCSGFNDGSYDSINIGDTFFVSHTPKNIDYSKSPTEVRASKIEAYGEECIGGSYIDDDPCSSCDKDDGFFN